MTRIFPEIPVSTSIPGTAVDFPEPVGAFKSTRARCPRTASCSAISISNTGNFTPEDYLEISSNGDPRMAVFKSYPRRIVDCNFLVSSISRSRLLCVEGAGSNRSRW